MPAPSPDGATDDGRNCPLHGSPSLHNYTAFLYPIKQHFSRRESWRGGGGGGLADEDGSCMTANPSESLRSETDIETDGFT